MNKIKIYLSVILFLSVLLPNKITNAQTCGFGCLGLSGVYGGYGYQQFNADGLNNFIALQDAYSSIALPEIKKFKDAKGFRVGANLIRFDYKDFIFSVKGSYQLLESKQTASQNSEQIENDISATLKLDYWAVGIDFGYSVSSFLDLKFADAQVTFHSAKLNLSRSSGSIKYDNEYKTDKSVTGYFIGSGFILNFVKNYLSFEATAGYTNFRIKELQDDKNILIPNGNNNSDLIKSGGLTVFGQLNIGIPLY